MIFGGSLDVSFSWRFKLSVAAALAAVFSAGRSLTEERVLWLFKNTSESPVQTKRLKNWGKISLIPDSNCYFWKPIKESDFYQGVPLTEFELIDRAMSSLLSPIQKQSSFKFTIVKRLWYDRERNCRNDRSPWRLNVRLTPRTDLVRFTIKWRHFRHVLHIYCKSNRKWKFWENLYF